jgi:hypothetical protein
MKNTGVYVIRIWAMVVFFLFIFSAIGQTQSKASHFLRKAKTPLHAQAIQSNPVDTIHILAVMVEFQTDHDERTTGDGTFQIEGTQEQIDPPPHDSAYFKNKIRFVENYFRKASHGKLTIDGDVLDKRIILSKPMTDYAPPTTGIDNSKLAALAEEAWTKVNIEYPGISFSRYNLFVLFHAGVGRDIDMVSILAYNPTPHDIPSLYLDSTAFAAARGEPSFNGLVNGFIKNTIILPETESRVIQNDTLQLSINGLFAASVGSYLGLPDLFDTKTGRSGIGQYGLMDGAGIFAYHGIFPPEPSAWEKIRLGWVVPQLVQNSTTVTLPAVGLTSTEQDVVYKIPISYSEYFLLENRNRDPEGNGQTLTIVKNGKDAYQYIPDDPTAFIYYDTTGISGTVVDAENFDWAIASWADTLKKTNYYGGGILIWHIDENIIQAGLKTNTVNADIEHRGVELKEADGSKDIGQNYEQFTYAYGTEYGSPLDCWFSGNYAKPYKNIFDLNSFPNSNSNSGAASLITIKNFSQRSQIMSAFVEFGSNVLQRDSVFHFSFVNASDFPTSAKDHLYIPTDDGVYAFKNDGTDLISNSPSILRIEASAYGVAAYKLSEDIEIVAGVKDSILSITDISLTGIRHSSLAGRLVLDNRVSTSPSIAYMDSLRILVGGESGSFYIYSIDGRLISKRSVTNDAVASIAFLPISQNSCEYFFTAGDRIYSEQDSVDLPVSLNGWILAAAVSKEKGNFITALEKDGRRVISYNQSLSSKNFEVSIKSSAIHDAAAADIDGDGEKDVVVQSASQLSIFNRTGTLLDGFPISLKAGLEFTGTPLIVDFDGDNKPEIILLTDDGEIWVYKGNGKLLPGFPVQVTVPGKAFPVVYASPSPSNKLGIAVLSEKGTLDGFLSNTSVSDKTFYWWQHLGDQGHLNADTSVTILKPLSSEFLTKSRVYNWPNPVYGSSTQIRYFTSENTEITVTILDLAGVKIAELKGRGIAGSDNEISWDVSKIQSGVYLARIEARGVTQNKVTVIKIAVVK